MNLKCHNTARSYHCCNIGFKEKNQIDSQSQYRSQLSLLQQYKRPVPEEVRKVTIPLAVITVATNKSYFFLNASPSQYRSQLSLLQ